MHFIFFWTISVSFFDFDFFWGCEIFEGQRNPDGSKSFFVTLFSCVIDQGLKARLSTHHLSNSSARFYLAQSLMRAFSSMMTGGMRYEPSQWLQTVYRKHGARAVQSDATTDFISENNYMWHWLRGSFRAVINAYNGQAAEGTGSWSHEGWMKCTVVQ